MSATTAGLFAGLVLGLIAAVGGFGAFAVGVLLGATGLVVGLFIDGRLDLAALRGRTRSDR